MSPEAVLETAESGKANGCKEILFTLGDKPELRYRVAREALDELGFTGWCTADVRGGDKTWLTEVAQRMDRCLGL